MSQLTNDDLRAKIEQLIFDAREGNTFESEPELAEVVLGWIESEGYVKLDVDVDLIRGGWEAYTEDNHTTAALSWARLARQVLAALDGETT